MFATSEPAVGSEMARLMFLPGALVFGGGGAEILMVIFLGLLGPSHFFIFGGTGGEEGGGGPNLSVRFTSAG